MKVNYLSESLLEKAQANFLDNNYSTAIDLLKKAIDNLEDHRSPLTGHLYLLLAKSYFAMIQYKDTRKVSTQALEHLLLYNRLFEAAQIYDLLGHTSFQMGLYEEAIYHFLKVLDLLPVNSALACERELRTKVHLSLGMVSQQLLDIANQHKHFVRGYFLARKLHNIDLLARALLGLGTCFFQKHKFDQGRKILLKAFKYFNQLGDIQGIAKTLHILGQIYSNANEFHRALNALKLAYYLFEHLEEPIAEASTLIHLARIYLQVDLEKSRELCGQATDLLSSHTSVHSKHQAEIILGQSYLVLGIYYKYSSQPDLARHYFKESLDIFQTYHSDQEYLEALELYNNTTIADTKRKPKKNNILSFKLGLPG